MKVENRKKLCSLDEVFVTSIRMELGLTGKYQHLGKRENPEIFTLSTKIV